MALSESRLTPAPGLLRSGDISAGILYADRDIVVIDKPAGLPAHAGPRGGPSVESLFPLLSRRKTGPWLAHRLDTDTAGCLVIALRKAALLAAQAAFAGGGARKTYWALTEGRPAQPTGVIDLRLRKISSQGGGWRMVPDPRGDQAVTDYEWLAGDDRMALLQLRPRTGRTHQLRVHCAAAGFAILGDPVYGAAPAAQLMLLARSIELDIGTVIKAQAPVPAHMLMAGRAIGGEFFGRQF